MKTGTSIHLCLAALTACGWLSSTSAVTLDDSATYTTSPSNGIVRKSSYTITTSDLPGFDPSGSDKLVVTVSFEGSLIGSVSYAGKPMTKAIQQAHSGGGRITGIYYLDYPQSAGNLVLSVSANGVGISVLALSDVAPGVGPTAGGDGQSINLTTTEANMFVVASHANNGSGATAQSPLTPLFNGPVGSAGGGSGYQQVAGASSISPTFTGSTSTPVTAAAAFPPVSALDPSPADGATLPSGGPIGLSWTNLPPNTGSDVWVDVWFGTNPDPMNATRVVSAAVNGQNSTSATVNVPLAGTYYWQVNSYLDGASSGTPVESEVFSFIVLDADGDGLPDAYELANTNPSSPTSLNPGDDLENGGAGDGLTNLEEYLKGTDPNDPDSDNDTLEDGPEIAGAGLRPPTSPLDADTDNDGLDDKIESNTGTWADATDTGTNPTDPDQDNDGLKDGTETNTGTYVDRNNTGSNPFQNDTDGDGAGDWYEATASYTNPSANSDKPEVPYPLPDPNPQDTGVSNKPVKVYILSGQSNMVGIGYVNGGAGSLSTITKTEGKFPNLIDASNNWTLRQDVYYRGVVTATARGPLTAGQGAGDGPGPSDKIGPELGFGQIMGFHHDEPVLVLKASEGNRSLAWDFLPPGSQQFTVNGTTYAGYGGSPSSWPEGTTPKPGVWYAGRQYDACFLDEADWAPPPGTPFAAVTNAADVLANFNTLYPQWAAQGYEIAGFVWFQGHKDGGQDGTGAPTVYATRYEQNLGNLINALRTDFNAPHAPFVVATVGFEGGNWEPGSSARTIWNAQMAVGDPVKHPEFAGTVASVDTTGYWRTPAESPGTQGYHYYNNAETYMLVGDAAGRAMITLLDDVSAPTPDPMTFSIAPSAVNPATVGMVATTASDRSGPVEYYFENTTNGNFRDWSTDPTWSNTGLSAGTYGYRVKARDTVGNETAFSATVTASPGNDLTAPSPDPMSFATPPTALGNNSITMSATTATDINGVEYFFDCLTIGGNDSSWQDSPTYTDTGLATGTEFTYRVQARDKSSGQNATAFSATASATTTEPDIAPPTPNPATFEVVPEMASLSSVTMTATTGSDPSGPVEYLFTETSGNPGGTSSGWQTASSYTDTGLNLDTEYSYTVTLRDSLGNTGTASAPASVTLVAPPTPVGIAVTNTGSSTVVDGGATSATIANWSLNGGNAVVVFFGGEQAKALSATFAGETMTVVQTTQNGGTVDRWIGAIAYLINPVASTGDIALSWAQDGGKSETIHSAISLSGVASVVASNSTDDGNTLSLNYTTLLDKGFVVGAATNNAYTGGPSTTPNYSGRLDTLLYRNNVSGNCGVTFVYGDVATAGSYTDTLGGNPIEESAAAVAFESIVGGGNDFADWIGGFNVGGQTGLADDPDGDGNDNGVENFFGTAPDEFSKGLAAVSAGGNTFTFTHPQGSLADDLSAAYRWSKDLAMPFNADGFTDGDGTSVDFTTQPNTPAPGMTTVTATVSGTPTARLFVIVEVTQN